MKLCALFAVASGLAAGQTQSIIDLARKAPPEIFADTIIKLVDHGDIPASQRTILLTEAFQAAKKAREPIKLAALPGVRSDNRAALRDAAGRLDLDMLSLQSRVIKWMASTGDSADVAKARELFQSIDHPQLETRLCEDPMIADVSSYYETLAILAAKNPDPSNLMADLMAAVAPARSPAELANFATVLNKSTALPAEDLRVLLGALALKMTFATPDYRSFTLAGDELRTALEGIATRAREAGVPMMPLAEGVRKLIVTQMSSPRCNEEFGDARKLAEWFNSLSARSFRGTLPVIEKQELQPPNGLGYFKVRSYFDSGEGRQLTEDFAKLRTNLSALPDFLKDFSAWKPPGEDIDVFHQKITVLHGLFQLLPPGEARDSAMARTVEVLASGGIERTYPAEWLLQVKSFSSAAMGDRAKLFAAFKKSGDAGLSVFAELEALLELELQK
jgi:hypothetical protein